MGFAADGIEISKPLLSATELEHLNLEIDDLAQFVTLNGHFGRTYVNDRHSTLAFPALIKSVNLFALLSRSIDFMKQAIPDFEAQQYVVTDVDFWFDEKCDDYLFWHRDCDKEGAIIRCFICVQGGEEDSGKFRYMRGSHKINDHDYRLSDEQVAKLTPAIVDCNDAAGALIFCDVKGYHSRFPITNGIRRTIYFQLHSKTRTTTDDITASRILLPSSSITPDVLKNLDYFLFPQEGLLHSAGWEHSSRQTAKMPEKLLDLSKLENRRGWLRTILSRGKSALLRRLRRPA